VLLPFALFAGLLVAFANREFLPSIPGSSTVERLLPAALLLVVPSLLAMWALRLARTELASARRGRVPPRAIVRLSALAVPLCMQALFQGGAFGDWIDRHAYDSHLGRIVLTAAPAFLAELPRLVWATLAQIHLEFLDGVAHSRVVLRHELPPLRALAPVVRQRLGWPLLLVMPLLLLGLALDLLQLHRPTYVLALVTAPGITLGALLFLLLAVMVLPFWFRVAFAVDRRLPEPIGTMLRETARQLGFRPDRVLHLPTGQRSLNAMMVGPLPVGRCLCITDGLLVSLPPSALAGVVAHEVGHARMGHPALLMMLAVGLPLAAMLPLRWLDFEQLDVVVQAVALTTMVVLLLTCVRMLAHRFEHEADAASVRALGAGPCSQALLEVSKLALVAEPGRMARLFSLHPDERSRCQSMRRYENDPAYREQFDRNGRRVRRLLFAGTGLAFGLAAWAWSLDWPYERVLWRFYSGDIAGARSAAAAIESVPERWSWTWQLLGEELAVAAELAPQATDFAAAQAGYRSAWSRGEQVLLAQGPAAARPWFALALEAEATPTDLQRAVHAFCSAANAKDPERMDEIRQVVQRLDVPERLRPVFAEPPR
jgi:Zn-dependent protease with chaperone function